MRRPTDRPLSGAAPSRGRIAARDGKNESWQRTGPRPLQWRVGQRLRLSASRREVISANLKLARDHFLFVAGRNAIHDPAEKYECFIPASEFEQELAEECCRLRFGRNLTLRRSTGNRFAESSFGTNGVALQVKESCGVADELLWVRHDVAQRTGRSPARRLHVPEAERHGRCRDSW